MRTTVFAQFQARAGVTRLALALPTLTSALSTVCTLVAMRPPAILKANAVTALPESRTVMSAAILAARHAEEAVAANNLAEV